MYNVKWIKIGGRCGTWLRQLTDSEKKVSRRGRKEDATVAKVITSTTKFSLLSLKSLKIINSQFLIILGTKLNLSC